MTVKDKIIERINSINDPDILSEILDLISAESTLTDVYITSPEEKEAREEGLTDIQNGRIHTQEESNQTISLWLQEKFGGQAGL